MPSDEQQFNGITEFFVVITVSAAIEAALLAIDTHLIESAGIVVCDIPGTTSRTGSLHLIYPVQAVKNLADFIGNFIGIIGTE